MNIYKLVTAVISLLVIAIVLFSPNFNEDAFGSKLFQSPTKEVTLLDIKGHKEVAAMNGQVSRSVLLKLFEENRIRNPYMLSIAVYLMLQAPDQEGAEFSLKRYTIARNCRMSVRQVTNMLRLLKQEQIIEYRRANSSYVFQIKFSTNRL